MKSYKLGKRFLACVVTLALLMALMPIMSVTVYGEGTTQSTRIAVAAAQVGPAQGDLPNDNVNYGSKTSSELRTDVFVAGRYGISGWSRQMYLKFDISGMDAIALDKVMISLYAQTAATGQRLLLIQHEDTSLSQYTVTAANANATWTNSENPSKRVLALQTKTNVVGWYDFNVTTLVKEAINKGNTEIAFLLFHELAANADVITGLGVGGSTVNTNAPKMVIDTIDNVTPNLYVDYINASATRAAMLLAIGALKTSPSFDLDAPAGYNALWKDAKDKVADDIVAGRPFADINTLKTLFDSRVAHYWATQPQITSINLLPNQQLDLPSDFKLAFQPNAVTVPARATGLSAANAALTWSVASGDASVVNLDTNTGEMTLTGKAGDVQIRATANVGGVASTNTFNLSVEAVPYNNTDQQRNLTAIGGNRINIDDYLKWPSDVGSANIALWYGNATGAFTFGVDDNANVSGGKANWLRMNRENGAVFNFNVNPSGVASNSGTANDWRELLAAGNAIQSHTWSHVAHIANGYTSAQSLYEYAAPLKAIEAITGAKVLVFAGADGVTKSELYCPSLHSVTRGGFQQPSHAQTVDYNSVNTISGDGIHAMANEGLHGTREALVKCVTTKNYTMNDKAGKPTNFYGGWTNIFTHGWGVGTEPLCKWIKQEVDAGLLWTDSIVEVGLYAQERDTAEISDITNNITSGTYSFNLTDKMADDIFDRPLTIKVNVGATWSGVTAKQNGVDIPAKIVTNSSGTFVMVDAVPDKGLVVLTGTDTEITDVTVKSNAVDVAIKDHVDGAVVVVALFYGSKLTGLTSAAVTSANMSLPIATAACNNIKVMLWDGFGTMKPLCPAKTKQLSGGNWID